MTKTKKKTGPKNKITKQKFLAALDGTGGILSSIALKLRVDRSTVYNFLNSNKDMSKYVEQEAERIIDLAEGKLVKKITEEESWAIKYYLSTKGKGRGYSVKIENVNTNINADIEEWERRLMRE